jgi:Spy/CpxP family protein refolding chaperone
MRHQVLRQSLLAAVIVVGTLTVPALALAADTMGNAMMHGNTGMHDMSGMQGMAGMHDMAAMATPAKRAAMWKKLGITASQQPKIDALVNSDMPKMEKVSKEIHATHLAISKLYGDPKTDRSSLTSAYDKLTTYKAEQETAMKQHMLAMWDILTPAQRKTCMKMH